MKGLGLSMQPGDRIHGDIPVKYAISLMNSDDTVHGRKPSPFGDYRNNETV